MCSLTLCNIYIYSHVCRSLTTHICTPYIFVAYGPRLLHMLQTYAKADYLSWRSYVLCTGSISNCVVYEPQYSDNPTLWDCLVCFMQMHQQKLRKLKSVTFFSGPRTLKGLGGICIWKTNSPWRSSIFWSKYLQVDNDRTLGCILNSQVSSHRRQVSIKAGVWKWKSKEMFLEKEMQFCLPTERLRFSVCRQGSIKEERVFFSFTQMIQATFCLSHLIRCFRSSWVPCFYLYRTFCIAVPFFFSTFYHLDVDAKQHKTEKQRRRGRMTRRWRRTWKRDWKLILKKHEMWDWNEERDTEDDIRQIGWQREEWGGGQSILLPCGRWKIKAIN